MAAMRSGVAMLGRRLCGSSGSSAAASMGGRGWEIHHVFRPAVTPLPPLRPAVRNLEVRRHHTSQLYSFSFGGIKVSHMLTRIHLKTVWNPKHACADLPSNHISNLALFVQTIPPFLCEIKILNWNFCSFGCSDRKNSHLVQFFST